MIISVQRERLCNDVVACVVIRPWGLPWLCKQTELISPSGVEDKARRPHDSLTVDNGVSHPLILYSVQSKQPHAFMLTTHDKNKTCKCNKNTQRRKVSKYKLYKMDVKVKAIQKHRQLLYVCKSVLKYIIQPMM